MIPMKKIALILARWDAEQGDPNLLVRWIGRFIGVAKRLLKKWGLSLRFQ